MMKKHLALFLSLLIFILSFLAQGESVSLGSHSDSISSESLVVYTQQMPACEGEAAHPCHFGHLGGCAPITNSQFQLLTRNDVSTDFITKSLSYSSPHIDGLDRPPIS